MEAKKQEPKKELPTYARGPAIERERALWKARQKAAIIALFQRAVKDEEEARVFYERLAKDLDEMYRPSYADRIRRIASDESHHLGTVASILNDLLKPER